MTTPHVAPGEMAPGTAFGGFSIEGVLGRGAMGIVYRARDAQLDRLVALKVVAAHLAADEGFRDRFVAEARAAAMVEHPGIVTVYAAGEIASTPYIAMRLVDGISLDEYLEVRGRIEPRDALRILAPIASGLDAASRAGIVHRDVKPSNIIVSNDGSGAVLVDFGVGRIQGTTRATQSGSWIGTADYVAPEQIRGVDVDGRADEYALGCVLHEMLSGTPPFRRNDTIQTLWAHVNDQAPPLVGISEGVTPGFDAVLQRAMAKAPEDRYPTVFGLIDAASKQLQGAVKQPDAGQAESMGQGVDGAAKPKGDAPAASSDVPPAISEPAGESAVLSRSKAEAPVRTSPEEIQQSESPSEVSDPDVDRLDDVPDAVEPVSQPVSEEATPVTPEGRRGNGRGETQIHEPPVSKQRAETKLNEPVVGSVRITVPESGSRSRGSKKILIGAIFAVAVLVLGGVALLTRGGGSDQTSVALVYSNTTANSGASNAERVSEASSDFANSVKSVAAWRPEAQRVTTTVTNAQLKCKELGSESPSDCIKSRVDAQSVRDISSWFSQSDETIDAAYKKGQSDSDFVSTHQQCQDAAHSAVDAGSTRASQLDLLLQSIIGARSDSDARLKTLDNGYNSFDEAWRAFRRECKSFL